jgi:hypothetical protein
MLHGTVRTVLYWSRNHVNKVPLCCFFFFKRFFGIYSEPNFEVNLSLCLTSEALCHRDVWGSECIDARFPHLNTSWRWAVNFTTWPLYPRGKSPQYPLDRKLHRSQIRSGWIGGIKILDPAVTRTPTTWLSSPSPVAFWAGIIRFMASYLFL